MKARKYNRRILSSGIQPNVSHFQDISQTDISMLPPSIKVFAEQFKFAEACGSLLEINVTTDFDNAISEFTGVIGFDLDKLEQMMQIYKILSQKYDVVCTNPPYMNSSYMPNELKQFIESKYKNYKSDLFAAFIVRSINLCKNTGHLGILAPYVWMFISSYEELRKFILTSTTISSMVQLEYNAFEGACVPVASFTLMNRKTGFSGEYIKLSDFKGIENQEPKTLYAIEHRDCGYRYTAKQENFSKIPGSPVAYWLTKTVFNLYEDGNTMENIAHPKVGMQTSNNDKYLRMWFEIIYSEFVNNPKGIKWIKYLKGGAFRKWYGNLEYLLCYNYSPSYILEQKNARVLDLSFLDKPKITWTDLTSGKPSFRYAPNDTFYDISGHCYFPNTENQFWLLAYSNSIIFSNLKTVFNSTFHCQVGDVAKIVVPSLTTNQKDIISNLSKENVELSKNDWDSFETSWDFKKHPLI